MASTGITSIRLKLNNAFRGPPIFSTFASTSTFFGGTLRCRWSHMNAQSCKAYQTKTLYYGTVSDVPWLISAITKIKILNFHVTWRYCILVRIALCCYCHYSHRSNNRKFFSHTPRYFGNSSLAVLVLFCCNVAICSAFRTIALYKNECYFAMTL